MTVTQARKAIADHVAQGRMSRDEAARRHVGITRVSREYRGEMRARQIATWASI